MKLNRDERLTIIECLVDSINADQNILKDYDSDTIAQANELRQESGRDDEFEGDVADILNLYNQMEYKKDLVTKLGEAIGHNPYAEQEEE